MASKVKLVRQDRRVKFATRRRNRCRLCGRPRGFLRYFGLCRLCFRKMAHQGQLPGVVKSQ